VERIPSVGTCARVFAQAWRFSTGGTRRASRTLPGTPHGALPPGALALCPSSASQPSHPAPPCPRPRL